VVSHEININLNITLTVSTDGSVQVTGVNTHSPSAQPQSADVTSTPDTSESLTAEDMRELAAPYKKQFVISKKELEDLTKDEIIALGQGMLGIEIYKRQHKDDIIAEFWREYKART
jgi:hypothetical protein